MITMKNMLLNHLKQTLINTNPSRYASLSHINRYSTIKNLVNENDKLDKSPSTTTASSSSAKDLETYYSEELIETNKQIKKFNLMSIRDAQRKKELKNEPFIKTLLSGQYVYDYLRYPELTATEHGVLNKYLKPMQAYFNSSNIELTKSQSLSVKVNQFNLYGATMIPEYDGLGFDAMSFTRVIESLALRPGLCLHLIIHNEVVSRSILLYGNQEQKQMYLKRLANGELKGAYCYSEPQSGTDFSLFKMNAVQIDDQHVVLNGKKCWVTMKDNPEGVLFLVLAKNEVKKPKFDDDEQELTQPTDEMTFSLYIVEGSNPGIKLTKQKTIENDVGLYEVEFEDVKIAMKSQLGRSENSLSILNERWDSSRYLVGAICVGILKDLYKTLINFTINTKQFGSPICNYQLIKERMAKIETNLFAMESMTYMTAGIIDSFVHADAGCESTLTKIFCTDELMKCVSECKKIIAMKHDEPFNDIQKAYLSNIEGLSLFMGTNDVLKQYTALRSIQVAALTHADKVRRMRNPFDNFSYTVRETLKMRKMIRSLNNPRATYMYLWEHIHPSMKNSSDLLEKSSMKLIMATQKAFIGSGRDISEYQFNLRRLSDISMLVFAMNAVIARASRAYSIGLPNSDFDYYLVTVFNYFASHKVDLHYDDLMKTSDARNYDELIVNIIDRTLKDKKHSSAHALDRNY